MRYLYSLLIVLITSVTTLFGQANPPFGMNFLGNIDYNVGVIDVWGYGDQGVEYAILGLQTGVSIVDVTNPTAPVEVQFVPGITSGWRDMKTFGKYCYVSNESGNGLQIIDLSGLPNNVVVKDTIIQNINTIHNLWIDDAGYLYLVGMDQFSGGMVMLNLNNDPWRPSYIGVYDETYVHDVYVRDDTAYVAEMFQGELAIVDLTDRANPVLLGEQAWDGAFTHNTWLNDASDVCFTTDEVGSAYVHAWDVSDPTNIELLDRMRSSLSNGTAIPHNVHVLNDFLIISYYRDGVVVVDASRPQTLVEVGHYDTSPFSGNGFAGAWGAYPFLPSGNILVSDMQTGLWVIGPDYQRGAFVTGTVIDSLTGDPVNLAQVTLVNPADTVNAGSDARYDFGVRDSGTYQIKVTAPNYFSKIVDVTLDNGVVLTEDIQLRSIARFDLNIEVKDAITGQPIENAPIRVKGENIIVTPINLVSDANGKASEPSAFVDNIQIVAGKWGYKTQAMLITPTENSTDTYVFNLEPGYADDFDLDLGWTTEETALRGAFERVAPQAGSINGSSFAPNEDVDDDILEFAYVTQNGPGNPLDHDVDTGYVELISPPIDLTFYNQPLLTLRYWYANFVWPSFTNGDDNLTIEVEDNGVFFPIKVISTAFDTAWTQLDTIDVSVFLPNATETRVKIRATDFGAENLVEVGVDAFSMTEGMPSPPLSIGGGLQASRLRIHPLDNNLVLSWDLTQVYSGTEQWQVELFNLQGQKIDVLDIDQAQGARQQAFSHPKGVYLARLTRNGKQIETLRWIN